MSLPLVSLESVSATIADHKMVSPKILQEEWHWQNDYGALCWDLEVQNSIPYLEQRRALKKWPTVFQQLFTVQAVHALQYTKQHCALHSVQQLCRWDGNNHELNSNFGAAGGPTLTDCASRSSKGSNDRHNVEPQCEACCSTILQTLSQSSLLLIGYNVASSQL